MPLLFSSKPVDAWMNAADPQSGVLFRAIGKTGKVWGGGFTAKVI